MSPTLTAAYDGEALLNEVLDLMQRRMPLVPASDPAQRVLSAFVPQLAEALGRGEVSSLPPRRLEVVR